MNPETLLQEKSYKGDDFIFVCECGRIVHENKNNIFIAYIPTSGNPSTRTTGHRDCGIIFNILDENLPKKYSSKKELKLLGAKFAKCNNLCSEKTGQFLLEIDRLKSCGKYSDDKILIYAYQNIRNTTKSDEISIKIEI